MKGTARQPRPLNRALALFDSASRPPGSGRSRRTGRAQSTAPGCEPQRVADGCWVCLGRPSRRALTITPGDGRANGGNEPVPAAKLGADKVAVFAKSPPQPRNLNLQVLLRDN